jgi:outer membrane immunogenic protein
MKRLIVGSIALGLSLGSGVAMAADMAVKAPVYKAPVAAPVYNWTGFYIGANLGYSFGNQSTNWTAAGLPIGSTSSRMDGILGGLQAGYNWQSGSLVLGLEADIQGTGQQGTATIGDPVTTDPCAPIAACPTTTIVPLSNQEKLPWFGTVRGRLGFTPTDRGLIYATGGLAYGEIESNGSVSFGGATATGSTNTTQAGWTVGGGVEWALWDNNWTGKVEYLYVDLGTVNNAFTGIAPLTPITTSAHITDNIVRAGLNYHFH